MRAKIRESLGVGEPVHIAYFKWLRGFFLYEPLHWLISLASPLATRPNGGARIISYATRGPVFDLILERIPQTLWVVGLSYVFGILIAVPIGVISAYKQYSWFDQLGTFISMVGFSVPTFFTGLLMIVIFSVQLGWFPSVYDTTLEVNSWGTFITQVKQMVMPVAVLALYNASQISRFMRASMLDNLTQDYVRTRAPKAWPKKWLC